MIRMTWVFGRASVAAGLGLLALGTGGAQTLRYTILMNDAKSGAEVDTFGADGKVDSTYEYNDRGRGPKAEAHWVLDAKGLPVRVDVTGVDYLKAPIDEHFAVEHGQAEWKSTSEHGHAAAGGFYAGVNTPTVESALLIRLLAKAGAAGVPLYPGGTAHLEKVTETTVHAKVGGGEQSMHVTEYAISGISLEPAEFWLDDQMQLFATPGPWSAELREGWEGTNGALYDIQVKAERERYHRLAQEFELQEAIVLGEGSSWIPEGRLCAAEKLRDYGAASGGGLYDGGHLRGDAEGYYRVEFVSRGASGAVPAGGPH
jgi:hypothetical protein